MPDRTTAAEVLSRLRRWADTLPPAERDDVLSWIAPRPAAAAVAPEQRSADGVVPAARTPAPEPPQPSSLPRAVGVATLHVRTRAAEGPGVHEVLDVVADGPGLRARLVDGPAAVEVVDHPGDVRTADALWSLVTDDGALLALELRARGPAPGPALPLGCAPVVRSEDPRAALLVRRCLVGRGRLVDDGVAYDLVELR